MSYRNECASIWSHVAKLRRENGDKKGAKRATASAKMIRNISRVGHCPTITYQTRSMWQ
jgi:hypothetical protein